MCRLSTCTCTFCPVVKGLRIEPPALGASPSARKLDDGVFSYISDWSLPTEPQLIALIPVQQRKYDLKNTVTYCAVPNPGQLVHWYILYCLR